MTMRDYLRVIYKTADGIGGKTADNTTGFLFSKCMIAHGALDRWLVQK